MKSSKNKCNEDLRRRLKGTKKVLGASVQDRHLIPVRFSKDEVAWLKKESGRRKEPYLTRVVREIVIEYREAMEKPET